MANPRNLSNLAPGASTTGVLGPSKGGTGTSTTFSPGSIVFADSSGNYTQSNTTFYWDNVSARLGIGTSSPTQTLDVNGNVAITGSARRITGDFSNATAANRLAFQTSTTNGSTTLNVLTNGTGNVSQILLYGGSDPDNSQRIALATVSGSDHRITATYSGTPSSGTYLPMTFYTGGSEAMRIDTSGNFKIAKSGARFYGDFNSGPNAGRVMFETYNTNAPTAITAIPSGTSNISLFDVLNSSDTSNHSFGRFMITDTKLTIQSTILGTGSFLPMTFETGGSERLRISADGNVGIGTSSPANKLHCYTSANSEIFNRVENANGQFDFGMFPTGTLSGSAFLFTRTSQAMVLGTNNAERMRIDSNGFSTVTGSFGRGAPVTKTGNFTLADTENWIICNGSGSITVTLPAASSWTGRELTIKTIAAQTVVSASSNVVPLTTATAGTAILAATAGKWATLVSNGTNWVIMAGN